MEQLHRPPAGVASGTIRRTRNNPLHTIPIVSISDLSYMSSLTRYPFTQEPELGVKEEYLPYLINRYYDDMRTFKVENQWTKLQREVDVEEEKFPTHRFKTPRFLTMIDNN